MQGARRGGEPLRREQRGAGDGARHARAPPRRPNLTAQAAGAARVDLSWTASTDNVGVTNYEIYRGGQLLATVGNVTTYTDATVGVETPYQYTVRALDARQNRSAASNTATVTVPDIVKPTAPANLVGQVAGPARVDLSWTASTDNVGVSNYEIYRNGQLRAVVGNVTTYADTTVNAEVAYQYTVRALDVKQNRSDASNTATVTVPDTVAPTAPGNLIAQAVSGARVDLAWTRFHRQRGRGRATRSTATESLLAVIGNVTTYADTLVSPLTSYQYTVRAVDAKQNRSVAEQRRERDHPRSDRDVLAGRRRARRGGQEEQQLRHRDHAANRQGLGQERVRELPAVRRVGSPGADQEREAPALGDHGHARRARCALRRRAPGRRPRSPGRPSRRAASHRWPTRPRSPRERPSSTT